MTVSPAARLGALRAEVSLRPSICRLRSFDFLKDRSPQDQLLIAKMLA